MDDNTKLVWIHIIFGIVIIIAMTLILLGYIWTQSTDNPFIFRLETDNNTVKIAETMNNTITRCTPVEVECKCSTAGQYLPFYYNTYNNTINWTPFNLSNNWKSPNIVYVSQVI